MFARGTDIVGNQVVVGDQVALIGVIPKPANVGNQLPVMIDERVIDGDHAVLGIARGGVAL